VVGQSTQYALDPADPWAYRGDRTLVTPDEVAVYTDEWAVTRGLQAGGVTWTPLFGQTFEPSATAEVVYVATVTATGESSWGVVTATESGPEVVLDVPLLQGTTALPAALPGGEVGRLLLVAAPGVQAVQYAPGADAPWTDLAELAPGVGTVALEGDPATDRVRVLAPDGRVLFDEAAPDAPSPAPSAPAAVPAPAPVPSATAPPAPEEEAPATTAPPALDTTPYELRVADAWAYRGPAELQQHPNLAVEDGRLFAERGAGRDDGSWSDRPLLAVERPDGLSVLVVLHTRGGTALVTTTWQRQDEAPQQSEQAVQDGRLLIQSFVPAPDGSGVLLALGSPRASAAALLQGGTGRVTEGIALAGVGVWTLRPGEGGEVVLYGEEDGGGNAREYVRAPALRS
jgi:hypothetical protein